MEIGFMEIGFGVDVPTVRMRCFGRHGKYFYL